MKYNDPITNTIQEFKEVAGKMTMRQAAKHFKISASTVHRILSGDKPDIDTVVSIYRTLRNLVVLVEVVDEIQCSNCHGTGKMSITRWVKQ